MRTLSLVVLAACSSERHARTPNPQELVPTTFATLAIAPGNITATRDGRLFTSRHQFYNPHVKVVELRDSTERLLDGDIGAGESAAIDVIPYAEAAGLDSVLGIRADDDFGKNVVWLLDNAMVSRGKRKLVGWDTKTNKLDRTIDLSHASPDDAFLNDMAVDRKAEAIYISDPAGGKNAALIVVDLKTNTARRVLEGHESVVPTDIDLVIDGTPVQIKLPDGNVIKPHVGVNPITLDFGNQWLYFGPMHSTKLYRVKAAELRDPNAKPNVEYYAERPITDGITIDAFSNIYLGDLANNAIGMIDGKTRKYRELFRGPELSWIDSFAFSQYDGYIYVVANQLHRSAVLNAGTDATKPPFRIVRFRGQAIGRNGH